MKHKKVKNKGITLIALIITIIVMLILVAVTISVALNGGLIGKTQEAKAKTEYEKDKEILLSSVAGAIDDSAEVDFGNLNENLPEGFTKEEDGGYTSKAGNTFYVDEKGNIADEPYYKYVLKDDYVRDGLILHFDAIQNTRNGHSQNKEIWEDLSGNNNDGILKNFNNTEQSGWTENTLMFDGTDDGVSLENKLTDLLKNDYTIEMIVKINEDNKRDILIGNYNQFINSKELVNFENFNNKFRVFYNAGVFDTTNTFTLDIGTNQALSIVVHKNSGEIEVYKNNKLMVTLSSETITSYNYSWNDVWIGRDFRVGFGSVVLNGNISAVRIYNRALTEQEVNYNYETDKNRFDF